MKRIAVLTSVLLISCGASAHKTVDRTLSLSCPIVEAYGPLLLSELTKKPAEQFDALLKICSAARDVNESIVTATAPVPTLVPVSVAGAPPQ